MTCPHCGFENTDDREACFRCGQVLDLSGVDYEPPRLRRGAPSSRLSEAWAAWRNRRLPKRVDLSRLSALGTFVISLVPGLGHAMLGERRLGLLMAGAWLSAVLVTLTLTPPLTWAPATLYEWLTQPRWIPATVHAWIMADAYARRVRLGGRRADHAEVLAVTVAAVLILFAPAFFEFLPAQARYDVVGVNLSPPGAGLAQGDHLLVDRRREAAANLPAGAIVLYTVPNAGVQGEMLGRVMGGPGTRLQWRRLPPRLLLDGRREAVPEVPPKLADLQDETLRVAVRAYLVVPAYSRGVGSWQEMVVPVERIRGVAVEIVEPRDRRRNLPTR